ncbi:MAG: energy transducer TonB [Burkholderiaceae bacterium]|nr:energy transducer TonB [Burkholderiaceae bacterium]
MKRSLWVCTGVSLALHGALAIGWAATAARHATPSAGRSAVALQARLAVRPAAAAPATPATAGPDAGRPTTAPAPQVDGAAVAAVAIDARAHAADAAEPAAAQAAAQATAGTAEQTADDAAEPALAADAEAHARGLEAYVPRPQLTQAPSPREAILLDYPADGPAAGRFVAMLTLYIDEQGWVRRADVDRDEALPEVLRQAARAAFGRQRYSPGQVDGQPVRSRIRIEVVYESQPLPPVLADAGAAAPPQ